MVKQRIKLNELIELTLRCKRKRRGGEGGGGGWGNRRLNREI